MKKFAVAGCALFILGGVASAADLKQPIYTKAPPPVPLWSWTGFYLGGNVGYSWGRSDTTVTINDVTTATTLAAGNSKFNMNGAIGGFQGGYNWQTGRMVLGIETDFDWTGQRGSTSFICPTGVCTTLGPMAATLNQKLDWLGTLRGRLGVTASPILFYVTGGLAYGRIKTDGTVSGFNVNLVPLTAGFSNSTTKTGWTIGAGVEGVISGNWTAKVEYLYVDLGTVTGGTPLAPVGVGLRSGDVGSAAFSSKITDNILRVGVNYIFH